MSEPILSLLLVDDEDSVREPLASYLRVEPYKYEVKDVANFEEALQALEKTKGRFDVALIDEVLGEGPSGMEILKHIKSRYSNIEVILFTGWGLKSGEEAHRIGAYSYIAKPFNVEQLALTIYNAAERKRIRREHEYLSTLVQVSRELTQTTDLEKQLALVWNYVQEQLTMQTFFIALYDSTTDTLQFHQSYDEGKSDPLPERYLGFDSSGWGLAGHVVKSGKEQVWSSFEQAEQEWKTLNIKPLLSGKGPSQSGICLPLRVGEKIVGALSLQSYLAQAYDQAFLDAVRTLGGQVAPAIENARLFSNLERTRKHVDSLIASSFDAVISMDGAKRITVFSKQAEELFGFTTNEMKGNTVEKLHLDIDDARKIWDIVQKQGRIANYEISLKHRDGAKIPVLLSAVSLRDDEGKEVGQAEFLRDQRQVHLLEERLRGLIKAGQALGSVLEIDQILQLIMDSSMTAFPSAENGSIHLFDEKTEALHIKTSHGYSAKIDKALTLRIGEGFAGWVYEHGEPIVSGNVLEDKRYKEFKYRETRKQKSTICTPLKVKGKVIGALSLDNLTTLDAFNHDDVELLSTFAGQAANAIDNARLFQEAKAAREKIRASFEASNALVLSQPTSQLLEDIINRTKLAAGASWVSVVLIDELGMARNLFTTGPDNKVDIRKVIRPSGITMQVMRTGSSEKIENALLDRKHVNPRMFRNKVVAALCLPLSIQGKRIGVVWIHYSEPRDFPNYEIEALQLFVNQAAIAYDSARRMEELDHMRKAAEAMAGTLDPSQVLQQIVKSASEVLQADSSAIWSYDNVRNQFFPEELVAYGIPTNKLERFQKTEPKKGGTADTVMGRGWVGVMDISDPQYNFMGPSTVKLLKSIGAKSFQGVALKVGNEKLGVLYANYNRLRSFTEEDRRTLETFAYHAALAHKKARLLAQVSKARDAAKVVAQVTVLGDREATLLSVAMGTQQAMGCDVVTLYVYEQATGKLDYPPIMIGVSNPQKATRYREVPLNSIVYEMLRQDDLYIVPTIAEDALFKDRRFAQDERIESCIAIPLKVAEQKVGVMFVNYHSPHSFTADELTNIQLFANQAAVAIRNTQLYQAEHRYTQTLQAIQTTSAAVSSVLESNILLPMITNKAAEIFIAPATSLMLWDEHQENLVIRAAFGLSDEYQQSQRIPRYIVDKIIAEENLRPQAFNIRHKPIGDPKLVESEGLYNVLVAPLTIGKELIGILNVYSKGESHQFEEKEKELAAIFANHAAIAINNAKLHERTKEQAETLEGLYEAGRAITGSLAMDETLKRISEQALHVVGAQSQEGCFSHVALLEENRLCFIAGFPLEILDDLQQNVGEIDLLRDTKKGIAGLAVITRQSKNELEVSNGTNWIPLREGVNVHSQLSVPLQIGERVIGVLSIEHAKPAAFSNEDVKNIESLAAQAAIAIENARLFDAAETRARNLDTVLRISQTVNSSLELGKIITSACQAAVDLLGVTHSGLALFDANFEYGTVFAEYPNMGMQGLVFPLRGVPVEERLLETREPIVVFDISTEPAFDAAQSILNPSNTRTILLVPVMSKDKFLGSFGLDMMETKRVFTKEEIELSKVFASQVAIAIENSREHESLRAMKALVGPRTATEWMKMVSYAWGHAIKRESGIALRYLELLRQGLFNGDTPQVLKDLSSLNNVIERIKGIPIIAPLSEEEQIMQISLNNTLQVHLNHMWKHEPYKLAELSWNLDPKLDDAVSVKGSPQWILRAVEIFLDNALYAMLEASSPPFAITIATRHFDSIVEILVSDNGPGFPSGIDINNVGIEPVNKVEGSRGAGLGLVLAKTIAQTYGGDTRIDNTSHNGTTMVISLPCNVL